MIDTIDPALPHVAIFIPQFTAKSVQTHADHHSESSRQQFEHDDTPGSEKLDSHPGGNVPAVLKTELQALCTALRDNELRVSLLKPETHYPAAPDIILIFLPHLDQDTEFAKKICVNVQKKFPQSILIQSHSLDAPYSQLKDFRQFSQAYKYGANSKAINNCINTVLAQRNITHECDGRSQSLKRMEQAYDTLPFMPSLKSKLRILTTGDAGKHFLELKNIFQAEEIEVVSTLTVLQGLSYLENDDFDGIVIVSDGQRNDLVRFVKLLSKNDRLSRVPVLVLNVGETLQDHKILEFLSAGANAILTQDEINAGLIAEMSSLSSTYRHTENMRQFLNKSISTVTKDSVRICTRHFFDTHFAWLCQQSIHKNYPLALVIFKFSNPGKAAIADRARIKSMIYASLVIRDIDIATRVKGEYLVIACPAITQKQCHSLHKRILKIMQDLPSSTEDQNGFRGLKIESAVAFNTKKEMPTDFITRALNGLTTVKECEPFIHSPDIAIVK